MRGARTNAKRILVRRPKGPRCMPPRKHAAKHIRKAPDASELPRPDGTRKLNERTPTPSLSLAARWRQGHWTKSLYGLRPRVFAGEFDTLDLSITLQPENAQV